MAPVMQTERHTTTADNCELSMEVVDLENAGPATPVVLIFPAMAAPARAYRRMAHFFAERGYRVILAEPRGIGQNRPFPSRQVDYGVDAHLDCDWPAIVDWARAQYPLAPTVLLGHSLGGQLSAIYAGRKTEDVTALVLLNVPFVDYRNWQFAYRPLLWSIFRSCSVVARCFGYFPGDRLGFGHRVSNLVIQQWARWGLSGKYTDNNGADLERHLATVTAPVLSISFSDDTFYAPKKAVDDFTRRLTHTAVTRWHLSPRDLQRKSLGHFTHLRNGERLWQRIHLWLEGCIIGVCFN